MLLVFDYRCSDCESVDTRYVRRGTEDDQECALCSRKMSRLPAGTRTTFRFADEKLKT